MLTTSPKYSHRHLAYLISSLILPNNPELSLMSVNQIHKALLSMNVFEVGIATTFASIICSREIAVYIKNNVKQLLKHSKAFVRKRACILARKIILVELNKDIAELLIGALNDNSISVLVSATTAIFDCVKVYPHIFVGAIPQLYKLLEKKDNWLKIKVIQTLCAFLTFEKRLFGKLIPKFNELLETNRALSVETELYKQVVKHFEGFGELGGKVQDKIANYIVSSDANIRYMGVTLLRDYLKYNKPVIVLYKDKLMDMITSNDTSIVIRSLETISRHVISLYEY